MMSSDSGAWLLKALGKSLLKVFIQLSCGVTNALLLYSLVAITRQRDKARSECESEYHFYAVVTSTFSANVLAMFFFPIFLLSFPYYTTLKAFLRNLLPCSSPSSSLCPTNPFHPCVLNWAFVLCNFWYFVLMPALAFWGITVLAQLSGEDCKDFYQAVDEACVSQPGGFCDMFAGRLGRLYGQMIFQAIVALAPLTIGLLMLVRILISSSPCCKASKKKEDTKEALGMNKEDSTCLLNNPV